MRNDQTPIVHDGVMYLSMPGGVVLQNLKVVSTHAKALTQALGEKPSRLIFSGKPQQLTPEAEILRSERVLPATR